MKAATVGKVLKVTIVVVVLVQLPLLATRVYVPAIAVIAPVETVGLWESLLNPFGPVQAKLVIPAAIPDNVKGLPGHTGPLLVAMAVVDGTVKIIVIEPLQPFASVAVRIRL